MMTSAPRSSVGGAAGTTAYNYYLLHCTPCAFLPTSCRWRCPLPIHVVSRRRPATTLCARGRCCIQLASPRRVARPSPCRGAHRSTRSASSAGRPPLFDVPSPASGRFGSRAAAGCLRVACGDELLQPLNPFLLLASPLLFFVLFVKGLCPPHDLVPAHTLSLLRAGWTARLRQETHDRMTEVGHRSRQETGPRQDLFQLLHQVKIRLAFKIFIRALYVLFQLFPCLLRFLQSEASQLSYSGEAQPDVSLHSRRTIRRCRSFNFALTHLYAHRARPTGNSASVQ